MIGHFNVYWEESHVTKACSRFLAGALGQMLDPSHGGSVGPPFS